MYHHKIAHQKSQKKEKPRPKIGKVTDVARNTPIASRNFSDAAISQFPKPKKKPQPRNPSASVPFPPISSFCSPFFSQKHGVPPFPKKRRASRRKISERLTAEDAARIPAEEEKEEMGGEI